MFLKFEIFKNEILEHFSKNCVKKWCQKNNFMKKKIFKKKGQKIGKNNVTLVLYHGFFPFFFQKLFFLVKNPKRNMRNFFHFFGI
jgi:hypothetical protein